MKKLFFAGAFALAMLTSCQNSNDEITPNPSKKEHVTKKTTARKSRNQ